MTPTPMRKPAPGERDGLSERAHFDRELSKYRRSGPRLARICLRPIISDDGHFQGLEVLP